MSSFSYRPHLKLAHCWWRGHLKPGSCVVDATAGNGYDTLLLAQLLQGQGALTAYDIQELAIANTQKRLENLTETQRRIITLKCACHSQITEQALDLVVYNLGYLPGANKQLTTQTTTTLLSLQASLSSLNSQGALSIMCYPGHETGKEEKQAILSWLATLKANVKVEHYEWSATAPSWHLVQMT